MMLENPYFMAVFDTIIIIVGLVFVVTWLLFIRISMKYIEKQMAKEGSQPLSWDSRGMGWHISMYVLVLVRGKPAKVSIIDDKAILKHARPFDRFVAFSAFLSLVLVVMFGAIAKWGLELEP